MKKTLHSFAGSAFLLAALASVAAPAQASIFSDNEARKAILDLRAQIETINKRLDELAARTDAKTDKTAVLDLASENEHLRQEIARLRGQVEVLTNDLATERRRQKDFYVDLDNRLRRLEPQRVLVDGKEFEISADEQKSYDTALTLFKSGNYQAAENAFSRFLQSYPASGYAPSAHYWLGNTHYVQGDYRSALKSHETVLQKYPDNPKVPETMLSIASSYTELKDVAAARKTLESLIARYPDTDAAGTAKRRLSSLPAAKASGKR